MKPSTPSRPTEIESEARRRLRRLVAPLSPVPVAPPHALLTEASQAADATATPPPRDPPDAIDVGPAGLTRDGPRPPGIAGRLLAWAHSGRADPGWPGLRAMALLGVLAALTGGVFLWRARPAPEPLPAAAPVDSSAAPPSPPAPLTSPPRPTATQTAMIVVHVAGKVRHPGVYSLPSGSRVSDALRAAGGPRPGTALETLNLARPLTDGEQVLVGLPAPAPVAGPATPLSGATAPTAGDASAVLDLNTATAEQLEQLPGVGPVLARRIIDYRQQHGGFRSVDQLREVTGIGERKFADLRPRVRV